MKRNLIFFILISFYSIYLNAQVGINTTNPNAKALLHVSEQNNSSDAIQSKGIIIPRLTESQRNEISPGDTENSLMVFNTDEGCYNYWNSTDKEWKSLCGQLGKATFTIECTSLVAKGKYITKSEMTTSNFIQMKVTVTKPGTYILTAKTNNNNGYTFQAEGTFLEAGTFTVNLSATGTPITATTSGATGDQVLIYNYGELICDTLRIVVEDSTIIPDFSISCSSIIVNGTYTVNESLTAANTLVMNVTSPTTAKGAAYSISTSTVNGYSFNASGTLTGGSQQITLIGTGKPIVNGSDEFTLTTNSSSGTTSCSFTVKTAARKMKIVGLANADDSYNIARSGNLLNQVMLNANYFSNNQSAVYPVNGFEFLQLTNLSTSSQTSFSTFNPDIVLVQYNYFVTSSAEIQFLANYVANGGVLIYCSDGDGATTVRNLAARDLARSVFSENLMDVTDSDTNNLMTIQDTETLITNGPFLNLVGKSMGRDAGNNFRFTINGFPFDKATIIAYGDDSNNSIRAFVSKSKGFAFFGDGAPFAANQGTDPYNWPAKFRTTGGVTVAVPNTYSSVTSYNSHLFLNLMAWGINYAQKNRP
ncbi:hypothetical protein [Chishuiella sp.]|uniref:hypothetical protein n=1 Tax=Chishuiella sp. TaxID=1969467 RepID=UPI0028A76567|nr:hypothetical protein [Chishuiella sp.]